MTLRRKILDATNLLLDRVDLHILPGFEYRAIRTAYKGPTWTSPDAPSTALAQLQWDNAELIDLEARYADHPASSHTQWDHDVLRKEIDLHNFRGDNHYVYQTRWSPSAATYYLTAYYVRSIDKLGLFGNLKEDGLFGAYCLELDDGYIFSRDLLNSINQANVIARFLSRSREDPLELLDIGAGYGRLAHRLAEGLPRARITCTDAVPLSTFLCSFYLKFRNVESKTSVVPLDLAEELLPRKKFDIVTNIHSFSECPLQAIAWWLDLVSRIEVRRLLIVPNAVEGFFSTEADGRHLDFSHLFEERGWRLAHAELIYAASKVAQSSALYPRARFCLFER